MATKTLREQGGVQSLWSRLDNHHKRRLIAAAQRKCDASGFDPRLSIAREELHGR